ncbi:hypothetical protein JTE90_017565 [Oedothorax gibbosus]|uniref:Uncharacterized protein n=1 Tax=Oedothorax gibbosus TaxID=931172 RepID=A0AAV6UPN4_9ARAC|nr:hypothetical protein JTE90_017565 [Oedothorax gibbosus]
MALPTPAVNLPTQEESGVKIKKEKQDDSYEKSTTKQISKIYVNDPQLSRLQSRNITITIADQQAEKVSSSSKPSVQITQKKVAEDQRAVEPPPIDHSSICGAFGWATIGPVHLPVIMRGEEKYIAVRMFEFKINCGYFPTSILSCTNISSYYVTENEAILLNEINSFHCDYQFTYNDFTTKDYVVRLSDAEMLFEFLEFCKSKLYNQSSSFSCNDKCGFLNYKIPFVKKGAKKYISIGSVYPEGATPPVSNSETITHWDLAYFRFLSCFASVDLTKFELDMPLCNVEDLEMAVGVRFEEVCTWPDIRFASKEEWQNFLYPRTLQWISKSPEALDDPKTLRQKLSEIEDKETTLNSFLGLNKFLDINSSMSRMTHVGNRDAVSGLNLMQGTENSSLFPVALDNFLSTTSGNYPYPVSYNHYNSHIQTPSVLEYDRYRKPDGSLPSFSSRKPRSFPPPPPLVPLGNPRVTHSSSTDLVPKPSSLYPYLPPPPNASCPPWLARILEPDWLHEDENRPSDAPENLSRRPTNEMDAWCSSSSSSTGLNLSGAGSSTITGHSDRILHPAGGSPRLLGGPGPPPHYPTPPQSSPMSLLDCGTVTGFADIYSTRLTPNGLCSPPPSPDMRTSVSPRGGGYAYQPHITRLVQVDSRYVLAINVEPLKYASHLAVPISDVVNKFLRGTSVQSCQIMLETVFGVHLYECTSLQQEAFAKHNLPITAGSKLVLLTDLKNCLYQLKFLLLEREKQSEKACDLGSSELPMAKRWCGNAREC